MQQTADRLVSTSLASGDGFYEALARAMLECCSRELAAGDLSAVRVLVPALPMAVELRSALLRVATRPLLLPRFDTLPQWVQSAPLSGIPDVLPESERLVLLHEALRTHGWFDEAALWGIAGEMAALFDELTRAAGQNASLLPDDEAALAEQLERAYALRSSTPLAFEARVVHELWRALGAAGSPDAASVYKLRLAALARQAEHGAGGALLVLLDAAPDEALEPAERDFLLRYGRAQPVSVFHPAPRAASATPLMALLSAAWPETADAHTPPLYERARELSRQQPASPLAGRLQLIATSGREPEAQAAVAQIAEWLQAGLRRIVVITQDRLTARRVRALLERENVLVSDETGWKLSTSRAAAALDALLETTQSNAYFRDLLDLCKSPYIFADCAEDERKAAVFALESELRSASVKSGLPRIRRCMQTAGDETCRELVLALIDRLEAATTLLRSRPAPLARWIKRLLKALEVLGALPPLQADAAGKSLLALLEARRLELDGSSAQFSFAAWRDWLNREFEAATFRDVSISSPLVLTPLNAVCLRRFEAALLIGGDARQLAPASNGEFFNQSVRRELGLRTQQDGERELRRDLELLLATVPRVSVTWQALQDGEANLLAPELALLSTLHQLAWGDDLLRQPLPARSEASVDAATAPALTSPALPVAPPELIPRRVSVSAYAALVACPYRFFARYVLGLGEMDEVTEEMDKSEYGALVHRALERFHERYPLVSALSESEALAALQGCVVEVFSGPVADNFLSTGWRLRWEKRLSAYLDWQRANEAQGWRWAQAETRVACVLPLGSAGEVELYGRIDRIDQCADAAGGAALFDYKTQSAKAIRDRLPDDVQLPAYALMHGGALQAAYVALDDEKVLAVGVADEEHPLAAAAEAQGERLQAVFMALHAGAQLPAHGVDRQCSWCEMSGVCRRAYV